MQSENDSVGDLDGGLWVPVAELARLKGVTRQTAHERVARLVEAGKLTVRTEGRRRLINLAQYDRAVGDFGDAAREAAARTRALSEPSTGNVRFRDHQAREKQYAADLKFLELEERRGRLVPIEEVEQAADEFGQILVHLLDRLPNSAEAILAAGKDGPSGARVALKQIVRDMRTQIAGAIKKLALTARPSSVDTATGEYNIQPSIARELFPDLFDQSTS